MKKPLPYLVLAAILLSGCATYVNEQSSQQLAGRAKVTRDEFLKATHITSMHVYGEERDLLDYEYWFSATRRDGTATAYSLNFTSVRAHYYGWAFWSQAHDIDGNTLPLYKLSRDARNGGITYEHVQVELTREYIESHRAGMTIRIDGEGAQKVIKVLPNYIEGFLQKVNEVGL